MCLLLLYNKNICYVVVFRDAIVFKRIKIVPINDQNVSNVNVNVPRLYIKSIRAMSVTREDKGIFEQN